ncbi:hypothetical protein KK437_02225 [Clostridioides difficile]|nr:hypothetical protein [Clostridioides difficile]
MYGWGSSTICNILEKREYLGHTINFKTRKHFKDKKSHYVPEDEWTILRIPMSLSLTSRPLTLCRKSRECQTLPGRLGRSSSSQACFIVPIAEARCMSTVPTTASAFLNTPAHSTQKFLAGHSARPSTVSMKMWYCPLSLKC